MKSLKLIFPLFLLAAATLIFACGGNSSEAKDGDSDKTEVSKDGPEYTSAYVCPMHCAGSGSDAAGKCPKCGMDYVMNESKKSDADGGHDHDHDHDHDHEGHSH